MRYVRIITICSFCGKELQRYRNKTSTYFCDIQCKAYWQTQQRELKGYTKEFLIKEYIINGKSANQIAREIKRDVKSVHRWMMNYNMKLRPRGTDYGQNFKKGHTMNVGYKHSDATKEKIRQRMSGSTNLPHLRGKPHYLTIGDRKPASWKGGITPERQAFYSTVEWKEAVKTIWKRDNAICRRCGKKHNTKTHRGKFAIHHIISFVNKKERANSNNLILICRNCHLWIHSNKNINKDFIEEE